MSAAALAASVAYGALVGILSGLVGIGGGAVMVPWLYLLFATPGWSGVDVAPVHEAVLAHATSLAVIVPTALSGVRTYQKARLVVWEAVVPMAGGAVLGAVAGALVAGRLPPQLLKVGFALLLLVTGVRLLRGRPRTEGEDPPPLRRPHLAVTTACGIAVGLLSALLGVGGGLVAIPLLIHVLHVEMRSVAATSIGLVVFAATAGTVTYAWAGRGVEGLPAAAWGFVFLPAALALAPGAVVGARWGARLNQRLGDRTLRLVFAGLFLVMGVRLLAGNLPGLL